MPDPLASSAAGSRNQRIVLASRPDGAPTPACFRLVEEPIPEPGEGELLLRTVFLSLDPYMRGRMNDGPSYAQPVPLGGTMVGQSVSRVIRSRHPNHLAGDLVVADSGWQCWSVVEGNRVSRVPPDLEDAAVALGALGMPGFTAYIGLLDIGRPRAGETLLVSAATGGVGSMVGQIGKLLGCRVIGIAGGPAKCRHAIEEFRYDDCVDHGGEDFPERLKAACPEGVDVYFENVGGRILRAVLPLLNCGARVPLCGLIAHYNDGFLAPGPDRTPLLLANLVVRRIRLQGFLVYDHYGSSYEEFVQTMGEWLRTGKVRYRHDIVDGLASAPEAFIGLLAGRNFGKLIVRVGDT